MNHDLSPGYAIGGRYRVIRKLGEGGIGTVYLVMEGAGTFRAIKVLKSELCQNASVRSRFLREAAAPARIDSESVVRVVDAGVDDSLGPAPYVVMEHLDGIDLGELSDALGPLPQDEVLGYLDQLARVLDRAHARGVVHRDLKPENIFLVKSHGVSILKLLDFGAAKVFGSEVPLALTRTGDFFGTPLYMSPEQCLGRSHQVGPTSDVWALGLITFRLLVGDDYWLGETLARLIAEIAYEPMPQPSERGSDLGDLFDDWFAICCARPPHLRFHSAGAALRALTSALEGS